MASYCPVHTSLQVGYELDTESCQSWWFWDAVTGKLAAEAAEAAASRGKKSGGDGGGGEIGVKLTGALTRIGSSLGRWVAHPALGNKRFFLLSHVYISSGPVDHCHTCSSACSAFKGAVDVVTLKKVRSLRRESNLRDDRGDSYYDDYEGTGEGGGREGGSSSPFAAMHPKRIGSALR